MNYVQINRSEHEEWDEFVARHQQGTIYHSSHWRCMLEETYPHIGGRLIVLRDSSSGAILAGLPVYHVRSRLLGNRLVSAPHATWCDPLVSDERQFHHLLEAVRDLGTQLSTDRIEIRCRLTGQFPTPKGWSKQVPWKHHVVQLRGQSGEFWERLSLNSVRQMIKRAHKRNVVITADRGQQAVSVFYSALLETRKRLKLPMLPLRHFSNIDMLFPRQAATIYLARMQDRVLGGALILSGNRRCHLELTGEYSIARNTGAMQSLIWTAMKQAEEDGCTEFSFGRTDIENSGLLKYKQRWGTEEEDFSTIEQGFPAGSHSSGGMAKATAIIRILNGTAPRLVYRLLGSFLYRHWG